MRDVRTPRPTVPSVVALVSAMWMITVDSTSRGSSEVISLSGVLTIVSCLLIMAAWFLAVVGRHVKLSRRACEVDSATGFPMSLWLFLLLVAGLTAVRPDPASVQNASVYAIFIFALAYGASSASAQRADEVANFVRFAGAVSAVIYIVSSFSGVDIYGIRSISLSALIGLAVVVPHRGRSSVNLALTALFLTAILISLSRTALLVGMCMLVFLVVRTHRRFRPLKVFVMIVIAAVFVYVMFFTYEPVRDRFLSGDGAATFNGVRLNTSGRATLWEITWNSALQSPWFGHGPGTASELISSLYPNIAHPHNDYLRLIHDFGFIGAGLFFAGIAIILVKLVVNAFRSDSAILWSGSILLASILVVMVTDNVVIYGFVMFPAGYIIGIAFGYRRLSTVTRIGSRDVFIGRGI